MSSLTNKVQLLGNLGADPEVRYTPGGVPVCNFRIATNEKWVDKQGEKQQHTEWHRIVVWGKLAEICGEYLNKGSSCILEGRIRTRQWEDRDGNNRYTTEIHADQVQFLQKPRQNNDRQAERTENDAPVVDDDTCAAPTQEQQLTVPF